MTVTKPQTQNGNGKAEPVAQQATTEFSLQMDKTLGQLLADSDDSYDALKKNLTRMRQIKIRDRAREIADLVNPQRQSEEIMLEAERIVELESAGAPRIGNSIPAFRMMEAGR